MTGRGLRAVSMEQRAACRGQGVKVERVKAWSRVQ